MKRMAAVLAGVLLAASSLAAVELTRDVTSEIPDIDVAASFGFKKIDNVAQYKNADWSHVIGIARGVSAAQAIEIASRNPDITFFFHMKGCQMVLERDNGEYRVFRRGDAVFFSGDPWWGSAPGFADGYVKQ